MRHNVKKQNEQVKKPEVEANQTVYGQVEDMKQSTDNIMSDPNKVESTPRAASITHPNQNFSDPQNTAPSYQNPSIPSTMNRNEVIDLDNEE